MSSVWPVPLIRESDGTHASDPIPLAIVQKNNNAMYAAVLLSGNSVEGEMEE